jgi:hypothetical protein
VIRNWTDVLRLTLGLVVGTAVVLALLRSNDNGTAHAAAPAPATQPGPAVHATPAPATQPAASGGAPGASSGGGGDASAAKMTFPVEGGYARVAFKDLSSYRLRIKYLENDSGDMSIEPGTILKQVPLSIQALDGKPVAMRGFMIAVELDESRVKKFLFLSVVPGCLYCNPPQLHEYIVVTLKPGAKAPAPSDDPILVKGTMHVREEVVEGVVASIYQMDADSVVAAPGDAK